MILDSPGYALLPPVVAQAGLIPAETRAILAPIWHQLWFPPRGVSVRVLEDVIVAMEGLVLRADGAVVAETVQQHTQAQVAAAQAALRAAPPPVLGGTLILGRKPGSWNYGHFLVEILPRILLAREHMPSAGVMVQAAPETLRQVMDDALALAGVAPGEVVALGPAPVRVARLVVVDGLSDHGRHLSPLVIGLLERLTRDIPAQGAADLFVIRPHGPRRLADEDAVAAAAGLAGFRVIDPGAMAFAAQVAAFKGARRIVGVMGAGLANSVFAPPGAALFVLAPAGMTDSFYWFLAGLRGLTACEIRCAEVGPQTGQRPWDRDLHLPTAALARVLDLAPPPARVSAETVARSLLQRFDADFYLRRNPDVAACGIDPLRHFLETGWREGRDPQAGFSLGGGAPEINPLVRAVLRDHGVAEVFG